MRLLNLRAILTLLLMMASPFASAFTFSNDYLSFQISDDWSCAQNGINYVCEPKDQTRKRYSIITVTAKHAGPMDTIESFESYLKKPRSHQMGSNTPVMSQVMDVSKKEVQKWPWIYGLHMSSEIKDFYTIYLATIKNNVAIMVTLSSEKTQWESIKPSYDTLIGTIQLKNFSLPPMNGDSGSGLPSPAHSNGQLDNLDTEAAPKVPGLPKIYVFGLALAGLILIAAVFIFLKGS